MRLLLFCLLSFTIGCSSPHNGDDKQTANNNFINNVDTISSNHLVTPNSNSLPPETTEFVKESIQQFIENKIPDEKYTLLGEQLYSSEVLPRAYFQKLFTPLWLEIKGDSLIKVEQMIHFLNEIKYHGLNKEDYHYNLIQNLYNNILERPLANADRLDLAYLDLLLTDAFLLLSSHLYNGKFEPESLEIQYGIQRGKPELELDHKLYKALGSNELGDFMTVFYPKAYNYSEMVDKAIQLQAVIENDFVISLPKNYDFAEIYLDSTVLPRLLEKMDLLGYEIDSAHFTADSLALTKLIKEFQFYHGLNQDGEIGSLTFEAINTPIRTRLAQLFINMERLRWLPEKTNEYRIVVNIADYTLDLLDGKDTLLHMRTIVGRNFRKTPVFSSKMTYLVFSPTWTVPPGILRNDILPAVAKDVNYLSKNNMVVLDRSGKTIATDAIDWKKAVKGSFPYTIRQQPGNNNALGRVKFMFPNRHSVYLHDTPSKNLFARDERLFSSGCIRIEKPFELAKVLLDDTVRWNDEAIKEAMNLNNERTILLKKPVDIYIYYLTAWGGNHFRKDVYGRDQRKEALFNGVLF